MPLALIAAAAALLGSLHVFPWDSDASFLVNDALMFAHNAEQDPWGTLMGHHPGYHVLVNGATAAGRAMDIERPGHFGIRLVSGLGAAATILLLAGMAGPGRRTVGVLFALPLVATRTFVLEAGTGENVVPGAAAALLAVWIASRPGARPVAVVATLTLAMVLRQDNLLLVPACAMLLALGRPPGDRLRPMTRVVVGSGVATVLLYLAAWRISDPDRDFISYLFYLAPPDAIAAAPMLVVNPVVVHLAVSGAAVVGMQWHLQVAPHVMVGSGFAAALLLAAWMLRGRHGNSRFAVAAAIVLACRIPFYSWFEPLNHEWWLVPLMLLSGVGASAARGQPVAGTTSRRVAVGVLVAVSIATLATHAPTTVTLRDRTLATARDLALELGAGRRCHYAAYGGRAQMALLLHRVPSVQLPLDVDVATARLSAAVEVTSRPTILLIDRFIYEGSPWAIRTAFDPLAKVVDSMRTHQGEKLLRHRGRVVVIGWNAE